MTLNVTRSPKRCRIRDQHRDHRSKCLIVLGAPGPAQIHGARPWLVRARKVTVGVDRCGDHVDGGVEAPGVVGEIVVARPHHVAHRDQPADLAGPLEPAHPTVRRGGVRAARSRRRSRRRASCASARAPTRTPWCRVGSPHAGRSRRRSRRARSACRTRVASPRAKISAFRASVARRVEQWILVLANDR